MASTSLQEVSNLKLDLGNYRTVRQTNEKDAIKAMITIKPERFYAMMKSIIEDGYIPTENIIIQKDSNDLIVKEGNRRIAALKIIHGIHKAKDFDLPADIIASIKSIDSDWKQTNLKVPCAIYTKSESKIVDKIVSLTHAKGEEAGRDKWSSVATARHNRDAKAESEPALDLLEKYLKHGKNLTPEQKERWAGDYPLTVLHEAIRFLYSRLGYDTLVNFVSKYPKVKDVSNIDNIIRDIGLANLGFKTIRDANSDFALGYGFAPIPVPTTSTNKSTSSGNKSEPVSGKSATKSSSSTTSDINGSSGATSSNKKTGTVASVTITKPATKAAATNDPKHVASLLKSFTPKGKNREKVVTLRDEIRKLKIQDTPIAFCFLLRSMFEISAKAYIKEHSISPMHPAKDDKPAKEKSLKDLLKEIANHLKTVHSEDSNMVKELHGALTELAKTEGLLSVTSMNQLVHNSKFTITPNDICTLFGNIFPLLEAMNS